MHPKNILKKIYLAGFLFSFHSALTVYINSSFLAEKIPESLIGILYTASAIISIIGLFIIPRIINRFGTKKTLGGLLLLNIGNILGLILGNSIPLVMSCFVLFFGFNTILYLGLDILIEHFSDTAHQGTVRGTYLTSLNIGFMLAPLLAGYITERLGFGSLYGFSLLLLFPVIILVAIKSPDVKKTHSSKIRFLPLLQKFIKNKSLRIVFMINGTLQFFYVWMTIYTPLYLHEHIGIAWDDIGIIFTIMLSAFVFFQYGTGKLADRFHCEKYMMMIGLFIMGIATLYLTRAHLYSLWAISFILFTTRIGASIIEVTTESYFFKNIHPDDTGSIGFFRNTYPLASILASLSGSFFLQFLPLWTLFIILPIICCIGIILLIPLPKKTLVH